MADFSGNPVSDAYYQRVDANDQKSAQNIMKLSQLMAMQKGGMEMSAMQDKIAQDKQQRDLLNAFASQLPADKQAEFRVDPKGFMDARRSENEIKTYLQSQTPQPKTNLSGFESLPATQPGAPFAGMPGISGNAEQEIMKIANDPQIAQEDKSAAINQIMQQQKAGAAQQPNPAGLFSRNPVINAATKFQMGEQDKKDAQLSNQAFTRDVLETGRNQRADNTIQAIGDRQQTSLTAKMAQADLSPEALDNAAENYRITGNLPAMGMGGLAVKAKILNRAAEMAADHGDQAGATVARQVANKANAAALAQVTKQEQMIGAFEKNANMNADLALSLAGATSNTGIPVVTGWVQSGMKSIAGDPAISRFHAATETFVNEYAKIMSGSMGNTAISDAARTHAHSLLSTAMAPDQYKGVIDVLKTEMGNRMKGFAAQKQELMGGMGLNQQTPAASPAPTSAAPTTAAPSVGTIKQGNGGVTYVFTGGDPADKNNWKRGK